MHNFLYETEHIAFNVLQLFWHRKCHLGQVYDRNTWKYSYSGILYQESAPRVDVAYAGKTTLTDIAYSSMLHPSAPPPPPTFEQNKLCWWKHSFVRKTVFTWGGFCWDRPIGQGLPLFTPLMNIALMAEVCCVDMAYEWLRIVRVCLHSPRQQTFQPRSANLG